MREPYNTPIRFYGRPIPSAAEVAEGLVSLDAFVGRVVRRAREDASLSRRELAKRLGLKTGMLRRMEEDREIVSLTTLSLIARALGCRLEIRLERTEAGAREVERRARRQAARRRGLLG